VVRSKGNTLSVRIFAPDGPEQLVAFDGDDRMTMKPVDPTNGTDTIVFRRITNQN
jgi:hypothetical protein